MTTSTRPAGILCYFLMISLLFLVFICRSASADSVEIRTVKVGIYENEPKVFTSKTGAPTGIFIDIIEFIAKAENWKLQYVPGSWAEGLERLATGEIDLMPDVAYTADREKIYAFHKETVLSSWSQVYAKKGSGIHSILDLDGKRIATLLGSVQQEAFARLSDSFGLKITLLAAVDFKQAFAMVAINEADAAITNSFFGMLHTGKYGLEDTAVVFSPSKLLFAAPKNSPQHLLATIDRHLLEMKQNSESNYYVSLKKWTSEEVKVKIPLWLQIVGFGGLGFLVMSLLGSAILKHQVNVRTRELRQINQEMEERIVERTAQLAAAMEKAQAADRIKSAFLATMSHELRTPLNSIIGFTGIMLQGLTGPLNPEQHKQMSMVQNSSRHLLSLINDVLDISKIEAGQLVLASSSFDLGLSIDKMVKLVAPLAEKKGFELQLNLSDTPLTITTDQRRLEQVILNLLNNAVKFTETGSVRIACLSENDHFLISFTDTGIGIAPEEIANLFQPFHQVDTGLARKREGTGLGLSICKKIIDMMGGSIEVQSNLGHGSTFFVRLPRQVGETV